MDSITSPAGRALGRSSTPSPYPAPLLVGRTREQAALRDELAAATGGHGRLVLVGGEAGIGKTTLARDLAREADDLGIRVLTGSCYDLTNTPPYGPWLDLFDGCERDPNLPPPPDSFAGGRLQRVPDQAALFAAVRQFFVALTSTRPACVILEDLHWADPASLDLLRHIGPHLRHWPVLVLVTYRADELAPNRPFAQHLPALVREADGRRLDLRRLDADVLRALVASRYRLTNVDADRLVAYLERHAEGNPFFATELLRTLEEEGLLRRGDDQWVLAELDRVIVPALLRQVIDGRVARLGVETRQALAIAAVIGQEVLLDLWAEVAGQDEDALLGIVDQAVETHLLEADRDGTRVHFVHALTREALYEGILPPRRRTWHRRVAETLMASVQADPDGVAFHLQQAGDPRAWEWLVKAGDRAGGAYAWMTAAERLRAAASLLEGVERDVRTRARLLFRLAALQRISDPADAIVDCEAAERLAVRIGDAVMAAETRYLRGLLLSYSDRLRDGLPAMVEGIEAIEALSLDVPEVMAHFQTWWTAVTMGTALPPMVADERAAERLRAAGLDWRRCVPLWFGALAGQSHHVVADGERFLAVLAIGPGVSEGIRYAAAFAEHGLGISFAALGRPDAAQAMWASARAKFRDPDHHLLIAFAHLAELWDRVYPFGPADPAVRRRHAAEAEAALGRAGGALPPGVSARIAWLSCFVLDGRWDEALLILHDLPTPSNACLRREISGPHATIARHRGDPETAWTRIRPLFPEGPATELGNIIHQEGLLLQRLAADLCLDAGDLPGAHAWLTAHDAWLVWSGSVLGRADGHLAWARYYRAAGDVERARSCLADALELATEPDQPLVRLGAHRLHGEIATISADYADAGEHLSTALDLADTCDVPFERTLTLLALAEVRAATGEIGGAIALVDEARRICLALGATPTLARADAFAARLASTPRVETNRFGLTQRELDVLRLLAGGRSNPEIAEALFISRDTARTHVANIFRKLDVGTRAEAVDHAHRHGLLSPSSPPST
jgi:DNA-binding CsgD family transcriptional regulator